MKSQTERMRGKEVRKFLLQQPCPAPASISLSAPSRFLLGWQGEGQASEKQSPGTLPGRGITNHLLILVLTAAGRGSGDAKTMVTKNSHH